MRYALIKENIVHNIIISEADEIAAIVEATSVEQAIALDDFIFVDIGMTHSIEDGQHVFSFLAQEETPDEQPSDEE